MYRLYFNKMKQATTFDKKEIMLKMYFVAPYDRPETRRETTTLEETQNEIRNKVHTVI